ncbi:efflux RND transporter periplasmic adaptor subunit [Mangrovivirga sp. M17]|uniref:Efflux RND transporter periplasmic adaptor subunit n=1 Tax=Mangrovivirga halotolerans TaxID=2993936 RepID=A0ABT3RQM2_9BACT|nr:efflux RND transporter periplasmic adaptor subunit [Mangrovivirga halotolerans]MCX2743910.1 efflux RND transporter periplasmic adaptor subunit [Mangrovivirga halotolerans]
MKLSNKYKLIIYGIFMLLIGVLSGLFIGGSDDEEKETKVEQHDHSEETIYTCSMHPQIRQNEPGDCPICGMDLIPVEEGGEEGIDPDVVTMSETAMQLANIQTMTVARGNAGKVLRLTGKVKQDERKVFLQTAHIPGRIERLNVNFTGERVKRGQVIAYIYSPELVTAQEELFEAKKIRESQPSLYESTKRKLKNWKLSERQIENIAESGRVRTEFPITADESGYVVEKTVNIGDHVKQGEALYELADLSTVWVMFDLYESDLPWVDEGDSITFTIRSIPGKTYKSIIDYIDPVIDPQTRVASARVTVKNPDNRLKPEMFATGIVDAQVENIDESIMIPESAVLWTGTRSVVYVRADSETKTGFQLREVTLGPQANDQYIVLDGLSPGEEIVVNGTFSVDAAAQLADKPSMMNRNVSGLNLEDEVNINGKEQIKTLIDQYLDLKNSLVNDDLNSARNLANKLITNLNTVNLNNFSGEAKTLFDEYKENLSKSLELFAKADNIDKARDTFITISNQIIEVAEIFNSGSKEYYIQHCPMADSNNGADWLSADKEIRNPYFGDAMLTCGEVKGKIN